MHIVHELIVSVTGSSLSLSGVTSTSCCAKKSARKSSASAANAEDITLANPAATAQHVDEFVGHGEVAEPLELLRSMSCHVRLKTRVRRGAVRRTPLAGGRLRNPCGDSGAPVILVGLDSMASWLTVIRPLPNGGHRETEGIME